MKLLLENNKSDKILIEYLNSNRIKENIISKVREKENVDKMSIVSYMSHEKNLGIIETLRFFLSCCNSLKISNKIKDENLYNEKQFIHPKVMKKIDCFKKIKKIFSESSIEIKTKDDFCYLKGVLAYHYKVNLIFISYLSRLLNPKLCDPYYQPYYNFESKNILIKLNYKDNKDEIKEYMCSNTEFFDKYKNKIKDGILKIYRVQNPLISYQFHALQWNYTCEENDKWIDGVQIQNCALHKFDNKNDAEEF